MPKLNICPKCGAKSAWVQDCSVCMARIPCAKCGKDINKHPGSKCGTYRYHETAPNLKEYTIKVRKTVTTEYERTVKAERPLLAQREAIRLVTQETSSPYSFTSEGGAVGYEIVSTTVDGKTHIAK